MTALALKSSQIEDLISLRQVQRELPASRELAKVSANLEQRIGPTVSRRLAGEILRVSHTALGRWIKTGDVPLVLSERGREEVPTRFLVDLAATIDRERGPDGRSHTLEPVMRENRRRAEQIRTRGAIGSGPCDEDPHERASRLALAYHREVARGLTSAQVDEALRAVWRLREANLMHDRYADDWEEILSGSIADIRAVLVGQSEVAIELRQNSPFAGTLSEPERREIFAQTVR